MQNFLAPSPRRGAGPDRRRVRRHPRPHRASSSPPSSPPTSTARSRRPSGPAVDDDPQGRSSRIHAGPPACRSTRSVPGLRPGALCCVLGLLAALALAAPAAAQDDPPPADRSVLVILDGSDSMNADAGDGGTRLDAAKAALGELIDAVPEGAQVGLRVYGNELSGVSRAQGCRDTNLVTPVGPLDRDGFSSEVDGAGGQGPHADRPLAAEGARRPRPRRRPHGHPDLRRRRQLRPAAAVRARPRKIAQRGLKLSISVVGLQVNDRVRRQLECIAEAGGGTYVDAQDPEALKRELLAAFARAFRAYEAAGTPGEGHAGRRGGARDRRGPVPRRDPPGGDASTTRSTSGRARSCSPPRSPSRRAGMDGAAGFYGRADHAAGRGARRAEQRARLRLPRPVREHHRPRHAQPADGGAGDRERGAARPLDRAARARDGRPGARGGPGRARHPGARPQRGGRPGRRSRARRRRPRRPPRRRPPRARRSAGRRRRRLRARARDPRRGGPADRRSRAGSSRCAGGGREARARCSPSRWRSPCRAPAAAQTQGGAGRRPWSAAARSPTRRCSSRAPTATRSSPASASTTASELEPGQQLRVRAKLDVEPGEVDQRHGRRLRDRAPDAAARGDRRYRRGHHRQQHGRRRSTTRFEVIFPPGARRLGARAARSGTTAARASGTCRCTSAPRSASRPKVEFPVEFELEVIGEPQPDASPEPTPAKATPAPDARGRSEAATAAPRAGAIAGIGLAGLLVGLVGGGLAARRA